MHRPPALGRARPWPLLAALAVLAGCRSPSPPATANAGEAPPVVTAPLPEPPAIEREFRGVWVASVGNMDWPSRAGLGTEEQQRELIAILDRAVQLGLNAVILQVRPGADALYPSPYEPWSEYLTGAMGRAPEPYYDPLAFAVEEAHRRGLELHAWFNPYRARYYHATSRRPVHREHVSRARPGLVRRYGPHLWMDPGEPEVQEHTLKVILDVVRRYDVDGIHIDDYFYPYREEDARGRTVPFPDDAVYARYRAAGGTLGRSDWRRDNVDRFVERLYTEIKRERAAVKFGISPFGIWRPGHPAQVRGLDAYEEIYADARKWLASGWVDYFTPQLYWPIAQAQQSFPVLLDWWVEQNRAERHIWPGSYTGRVGGGARGWPVEEILAQIRVTRQRPGATGNVHFSMKSLMRSPEGLGERLGTGAYATPALVPASPWLHAAAPARPEVALRARGGAGTVLSLAPRGEEEVFLWTVRTRSGSGWEARVVPGWRREVRVDGAPEQIVVTAVGRTGNESEAAQLAP